MLNRLNLSQRSIVLVTSPLLVLTILISTLSLILFQIRGAASREMQSKELVEQATNFVDEIGVNVAYMIFLFGRQQQQFHGMSSVPIEERLITLCRLCEVSGLPAEDMSKMREAAHRLGKMMRTIANRLEAGQGGLPDRWVIYRAVLLECVRVFDQLENVRVVLTERLVNESRHIEQLQHKILIVLVGGLIFSLILAAALARLYAIAIKNPLSRIAENSQRLSMRQALHPPVSGNDEFSELDRLVHRVDRSVGEALAREHSLINNAADLICSISASGKFTRVSPFSQQLLGRTEEELIGCSLTDITIAGDAAVADQLLSLSSFSAEASISNFDLRLKRKDSSIIQTRWSVFWSEDERQLFCVVHDITEQKMVEQLREEFLDMVSQDLQAPLVSMHRSISSFIPKEGSAFSADMPPAAVNSLNMIDKNIGVLITLVNDILDFQKLKSGKVELRLAQCNLRDVIDSTMGLLRAAAAAKQVELQAPAGNWNVTVDSTKVGQVLGNLLNNAIKYAPKDSVVAITVTQRPESIEIAVGDSGPGIPEEFRDKIFEAFEQVPGTKGGSGLGLAICKAIVAAHGGSITVRPNQPQGSIFAFTLPKFIDI